MEQQDHIATLCAAGTVGIAVTGLALGVQTESTSDYDTVSGKRKWPGASSVKPDPAPQTPLPSRRVASQPSTSTTTATQDLSLPPRPTSLLRQRSKREVRPTTANDSDAAGSRASSTNRGGFFRPRTADTRSTSERRDPSANSSWLKRLSAVSSPRSHSPNAPLHRPTSMLEQNSTSLPERKNMMPNKLVKRSTSQRALSSDQAKGSFLKRPATSHQRSAMIQQWMPQATSISTPATPYLAHIHEPVWRPFFERGYSRKRPTTTDLPEGRGLRTISIANTSRPTLLLGSQLEPSDPPDDDMQEKTTPESTVVLQTMSTGRQRLRRSLSSMHRASRRRYFTDPTVQVTTEAVNGTMASAVKQSPLSPVSPYSAFDIELPHGSPSFPSSPPLIPVRHRFSFRKRRSTAPSDPTTASSDNDTRVFTDDDSMDFQSDTAHDSLNTRATVSSHSAFRAQKLDTVLSDTHAVTSEETVATLAKLVQDTSLADNEHTSVYQQGDLHFNYDAVPRNKEVDELDVVIESPLNRTPVKSRSLDTEDMNATPIAPRLQIGEMPFRSSPPSPIPAVMTRALGTPELVLRQRQVDEDTDNINWSPESDTSVKIMKDVFSAEEGEHLSGSTLPYRESGLGLFSNDNSPAEKRLSSIFDWSEHHKLGADSGAGLLTRPKTVHGKHGNEGTRSRSSGRKGPTHMHLRSQSVPNNRDPNMEQPTLSNNKYGTWGLGHKPVSEEWSDDFEFDDVEENISPQISSGSLRPSDKGTQRGVKVPQSIIDRQASVHIQFGQVQEFMLLVEELKQLRARGAALRLLEGNSKQLWEDAESIIDLATINNEEDDEPIRPDSPTPSDAFADELSVPSRSGPDKTVVEEVKRNSFTPRSVSSPATPPQGRARGESLAQAKNFLQTIHQSRAGYDSSPLEVDHNPQRKLPFDTQDLKDLVVKSGVITRALKEIVRKAEGLSASPEKTPPRSREPAFSQIFHAPDSSPCPPFRKPGLPKSRSANSYLIGTYSNSNGSASAPQIPTALVS